MTSLAYLRAAARCWERAGFYEDAAERFTTAEAWRDAGRCFSQAERHADAALAYSLAGEPLLEAREYLMASWPERARSLHEQMRSSPFLKWPEEVEIFLSLHDLAAAIRAAIASGDRKLVALLAPLASARGRPDVTAKLWLQTGELSCMRFTPWNHHLSRQPPTPAALQPGTWPSLEFSTVGLVPIWKDATEWSPIRGDCSLAWSADSAFFAAANYVSGLARGHVGPQGVRLRKWQFTGYTHCTAFVPTSNAVVVGLSGYGVFLVDDALKTVQRRQSLEIEEGSVGSISFAPNDDRVAISAVVSVPTRMDGSWLKICTWQATGASAQRELDLLWQEGRACQPITTWSQGGLLYWSPGPWRQSNRLFAVSPGEGYRSVKAHDDQITSLAFTADDRFLISASLDQTVVVRDGADGESLSSEFFNAQVAGAAVHPHAALVAVGEGDRLHSLCLHFDGPRLSRLSEQKLGEIVTALSFSPDGRYLLLMSSDYQKRRSGHLHLFRVDLKP